MQEWFWSNDKYIFSKTHGQHKTLNKNEKKKLWLASYFSYKTSAKKPSALGAVVKDEL